MSDNKANSTDDKQIWLHLRTDLLNQQFNLKSEQ
jgi:hypothetical protein